MSKQLDPTAISLKNQVFIFLFWDTGFIEHWYAAAHNCAHARAKIKQHDAFGGRCEYQICLMRVYRVEQTTAYNAHDCGVVISMAFIGLT